jgi:PhnB protein
MAEPPQLGANSGAIPYLSVNGGKDAIAFYKKAFGAEEVFRMPDQKSDRLMHAHLRINGGSVFLSDHFEEHMGPRPAPAGITLHLSVDDADAWYKRALDAGASVQMALADQFWGDRYGQVKDPFGYVWSIGAPIKK